MSNAEKSKAIAQWRQELRKRVNPDLAPLILELTEATLDRGLKWEPTKGGFLTTIGITTFTVHIDYEEDPPQSSYMVFSMLNTKGKEIWRSTGADSRDLYHAVKRMADDVDHVIEESLSELLKLYPKKTE